MKKDFSGYPASIRPQLEELRESGIDLGSLRADEFLRMMRQAEEEASFQAYKKKVLGYFDKVIQEHEVMEEEHEKVSSFVRHLSRRDMNQVKELCKRFTEDDE